MALFEQMAIGELTLTSSIKDAAGNFLLVYGTSTPTGAGYAVGCIFVNTSTGKTYQNEGTISSASFNSIGDIGTADIGANVITPVKMGTRTVVALTDAAATPTIAQLMTSSLFTITPTVARTFTVPTAALTVAGITGATVGSWFDFVIVNTAAFAVTVTGNTGWTLSGNVVVNKGSGTFRAVLTNVGSGTEAVTVYRMASGSTITDMALASGKLFVGQSTGLAAEATPSGDATISTAGVLTIGAGVVTRAKQTAASGSKADRVDPATFAITGNTSSYLIVSETGTLSRVDFSGADALAAHDTNFTTFSITNLGQAGGGSTAMLAATDANTTKATGGTALFANTKRTLTLHGTPANLDVVQGDRLLIRAAASGTLANTVSFPVYCCHFSGTT